MQPTEQPTELHPWVLEWGHVCVAWSLRLQAPSCLFLFLMKKSRCLRAGHLLTTYKMLPPSLSFLITQESGEARKSWTA